MTHQAIKTYLTATQTHYERGIATEHTYRGDLANLLKEILPNILPTNEPARIDCGAPDYVLTKNDLPIGYIEAKDLGLDLNDKKYTEQFDRYKAALNNLVFTNYLIFVSWFD